MNELKHLSIAGSAGTPISDPSPPLTGQLATGVRYICSDSRGCRSPESPELLAFQNLVNKCLSLTDAPVAMAVVRFVIRSLERIDISNALRYDVRRWLGNKNYAIQAVPTDADELRRITSLVHVGFREYLGPAMARQLLCKAMNQLHAEGVICRDALARLI
ncbi:hypothetical protein F6455_08410 [Proteobacteria bacterium 005FR1]|nr:hypothetical protein [Proteobacteria bacterium 005FR1]